MFNSFEVTVMRGLGYGQLYPVEVTIPLGLDTNAGAAVVAVAAACAGAVVATGAGVAIWALGAGPCVAVGWAPQPDSTKLNPTSTTQSFQTVEFFISSSLRMRVNSFHPAAAEWWTLR